MMKKILRMLKRIEIETREEEHPLVYLDVNTEKYTKNTRLKYYFSLNFSWYGITKFSNFN